MIKQHIYWIWNALQGIRLRIALSSIVGILDVCFALLFVWVCKQLIDIATHAVEGQLWHYAILLIVVVTIEIALTAWNGRIDSENDIRFKNKLRHTLFSHLMFSMWDGHKRLHSGDVVNRLEEDVRMVSEGACQSLSAIVITCFQLVAAFFFLTQLNSQLAWIIALIMPMLLLLSKVYMMKMRRLTKDVRNTDGEVQSHIQEKLQHKILIQTLGQNKKVGDRLDFLQLRLYKQVMSRTNFNIFSKTLVMTGFAAGYIIAFLWGVNGLYDGVVSFGVMTAFLQLVGQIQRPMVDLSRHIPSLTHAITSAERLKELSDMPSEDDGEAFVLDESAGIRFEDVSFAYAENERLIIDKLSVDFPVGSRTAIIGETGVGKSTLLRLMLSLLYPQEGKIYLYNDRQQVAVSPATRSNMVYVPQGNTLLSGTVRDNLLLGNPDATDRVWRARSRTERRTGTTNLHSQRIAARWKYIVVRRI